MSSWQDARERGPGWRKRADEGLRALRTAAHPRPGGATVLPRMAAVGGQRQPLYLRPLTASGGAVLRVLTLPRLQLLGGAFPATGLDQTYGEGRPTLPKFGAKGYAGRVQQLGGMLTLPRIRAIASGGTGHTLRCGGRGCADLHLVEKDGGFEVWSVAVRRRPRRPRFL